MQATGIDGPVLQIMELVWSQPDVLSWIMPTDAITSLVVNLLIATVS